MFKLSKFYLFGVLRCCFYKKRENILNFDFDELCLKDFDFILILRN